MKFVDGITCMSKEEHENVHRLPTSKATIEFLESKNKEQEALINELVEGLRYAFRYMPAEEQRQHTADIVTKAERRE